MRRRPISTRATVIYAVGTFLGGLPMLFLAGAILPDTYWAVAPLFLMFSVGAVAGIGVAHQINKRYPG